MKHGIGLDLGSGRGGGFGNGHVISPIQYTPTLWLDAQRGISTGGARQYTLANSEYHTIADASQTGLDPLTSDFAIETWIYPDTLAAASTFFGKGFASDADSGYILQVQTNGAMVLGFADGTAARLSASTAAGLVSTGAWHQLIVNFDRDGNATLYINGTLRLTLNISSRAGSMNSVNRFSIGAWLSGFDPFNGRIARSSLWTRLLTDAERTQLYDGGTGLTYGEFDAGLLVGLVSRWNGNETSGNLIDQHAANDLTDTNTVTSASGPGTGTAVHGDPVNVWDDYSGNDNHALQSTLAKRPTYREDSGIKKVRFDGVDDVMVFMNAIDFGNDRTLFAVGQLHDETGVITRVLFAPGGANWYAGITDAADVSFSSYLNASVVQETDAGTLAAFNTRRKAATYRWSTSGANVNVMHKVNDADSYNATDGDGITNPPSQLYLLGGFNSTPSNPIPIDLNELIVYDSALSATDQATIRAYLYSKWGITP